MRQFAAEVLKIRTIRSGYWIVLSMLVLVALPVISVLASEAGHVLAELNEQRQIVRLASIADVFALLLGIVLIGGELRHGTITQTFLVEPVRERVLALKGALGGLLGAGLAVLAVGLTLLVTSAWLSADGIDLDLHDAGLQRTVLGIVLGGALAGALGVGWGCLFRGQGSAIGAALVWLLIGENVLALALKDKDRYTPGHAFAALVSGNRAAGTDHLGMWPGALLAAAYALGLLVVGTLALSRRDI